MAQQLINIGLTPNDKSGDLIRTAFDKVNQNFTELYAITGIEVQSTISNGTSSISIPSTDGNAIISISNGTAEYSFDATGILSLPANGSILQNRSKTESLPVVSVSGGATSVVYSSDNWFTGFKLTIIVEGKLDNDVELIDHTQVAEATVAATYNSSADPVISVYGVVYTSLSPLATFTVRRTGNTIEVLATNTQLLETTYVSVKATKFVSYYD